MRAGTTLAVRTMQLKRCTHSIGLVLVTALTIAKEEVDEGVLDGVLDHSS